MMTKPNNFLFNTNKDIASLMPSSTSATLQSSVGGANGSTDSSKQGSGSQNGNRPISNNKIKPSGGASGYSNRMMGNTSTTTTSNNMTP